MKRITTKLIVITITVVVCLFVMSCKHTKEHEYHTIKDKIEDLSKNYKKVPITSDKYNEMINKVEVVENLRQFYIPDRKSQMQSFNCSECHTQSLKSLQNEEVGKKAHWNIKLIHADTNTMNCLTCHAENDLNSLHSLTNIPIDLNYSHKLCAQCHQREFKDWSGGSHGKQLGGWAPPRVSQTCVGCHNPHQPQYEKRWPVRFNTQKVKERQ